MSEWITPKTDWAFGDAFNIVDYNRIRNNLNYIGQAVIGMSGYVDIIDMGDAIPTTDEGYKTLWDVNMFNAWENNLETYALKIYQDKYYFGYKKVFYANGTFITAEELNRIESACIELYEVVRGWELGRLRLPFELGNERDIRV